MAYDFQAAVAAASAAVNQAGLSGESKNYKFPLVYPQPGQTMVVRLLFNPASGQIVRLVNRHEKVPCLRTYGAECPICKVMQEVKDATGQDPFGRTKASRARGISFAQFISSTIPIDKGGDKGVLQAGDNILFMYPWSVYNQISALIQAVAQTPTGMDQAFSHANQGLYIQISVTPDFKYTTTTVPFMTYTNGMNDEEFIKMLDGMESLNDQVIPATINETVESQVKEYSEAIYRQFIAPRIPSQTPQTAPAPMSQQSYTSPSITSNPTSAYPQQPTTPTVGISTVNQSVNPSATTPACMGNHNGSPQCICCPLEVQCIGMKK